MSERVIFVAVAGSCDRYCFSDVDSEDWTDWALTPSHTLLAHDVATGSWWTHLANACIVSFCRYRRPGRDGTFVVALSDEGCVFHIGTEEGVVEKIPEAGLHLDDSEGYGAMSAIRQIGPHLYAVGWGGQVYQRSLTGAWRHFDEGLLLPRESTERCSLKDIGGTGEADLYVVSDNCVHWFDGVGWRRIIVREGANLRAILVENTDRIWLCGRGTLFVGNGRDGFIELETETDESFLSITMHEGTIYLGAEAGVMVYDRRRVTLVDTGLEPPPGSKIVDSVDGVLWSFGFRDIARFDGERWARMLGPAAVRRDRLRRDRDDVRAESFGSPRSIVAATPPPPAALVQQGNQHAVEQHHQPKEADGERREADALDLANAFRRSIIAMR